MLLVERKSIAIPAEFKADAGKRQIEGYASTFNNIDLNDDIVLPGAYTRTLETDFKAARIKVKRNHEALIGKPIHMEQDSKGLHTISQISDTPLGNETITLVQDGVINEMSIGFRTEEKSYLQREGRRIREVKSAKLFEYSFMDDPAANPQAQPISVKSLADVGCALDQMSSALWHLRALGGTPPEVLKRLIALSSEIEAITEQQADAADEQTLASVAAALTELQSLLTPPSTASA